jgi:hypothetical protein
MRLPNVWGDGGALFAFSGMDGETDWRNPLVGSTLPSGRGIKFHSPGSPIVRFGVRVGDRELLGEPDSPFDCVEDEIVNGGLIVSRIAAGGARLKATFVFLSDHVVGIKIDCEQASSPVEVFVECATADGSQGSRVFVELAQAGDSAAFTWTPGVDEGRYAVELASDDLAEDMDRAVQAQLAFFERLPAPNTQDDGLARTYHKAASVLKVNCWSAQERIVFPWTTPDRWPHVHMWIWDSAFHAIGLRHISGEWAENAIKAVLCLQRENGFIPHMMTPDGVKDSTIIQPPIVAWASWKVYEVTRNRAFLEYIAPRLQRMFEYDCRALDSDGNGLSEWESSGASGMDNSPRFDQPIKDAVDLNSYLVNDMRWTARILMELNDEAAAHTWDAEADARAERINRLLWDDESGLYYDNAYDGELVKIKTEAGFTPMFAGVCDDRQAARLVEHLMNPREFRRAFPVASVSADEPTFSDNMWRGPVWINYNYLIIEGLRRYGYHEIADDIRDRTLREIARWYASDGLIYEFYDSEAVTSPVFLHRKKVGGPQAVKAAAALGTTVCDYNWTAALFIDLLRVSA